MTARTFAESVGAAIAGLRRMDELAVFCSRLVDPHPGATVAESVAAMAEEGQINAGWMHEYCPDDELVAESMADPALAAVVWVATLAARDDDAAFLLYHRLIGVDVDG